MSNTTMEDMDKALEMFNKLPPSGALNNAQLINQDSGDFEYYTLPEIVDLAREVMGFITLDPASSTKANERVQASAYMDKIDNALSKDWFGSVWMNHPFSKGEKACPEDTTKCKKKKCVDRGYHITEDLPSNADWVNKLISEYESGNIKEACCITFAATSEKWFRPLLGHLQCFIHGRTNYYLPDGTLKKGVTKGSVVTYLGKNPEKFREVFSIIGTVK